MPIALGVTALQSNNRKINFYSKYRENKLQAPTKTVVTYHRLYILRTRDWKHRFLSKLSALECTVDSEAPS